MIKPPKIPDAWREKIATHLPDILTGANAVGVVATALLTGKAMVKATALIKNYECQNNDGTTLTLKQKTKLTWQLYILPVTVGAATIASGVASNRISAQRLTEAVAVGALWADKYKALEGKVEEKFGKDKMVEAKQEVKEQRLREPIGEGRMLCYEPVSKQYFEATQQQLLMAEITANKIFKNDGCITMNQFLALLPNCKPMSDGKNVGWWESDEECPADFNWSFYKGAPWVDIQPQIHEKGGRQVLVLAYGLWPMEHQEWINGDTNGLLRMKAGVDI